MAKKEQNENVYHPDPNRETILVADKNTGRIDVVSEFKKEGQTTKMITVTPESKNRPAFYPMVIASDAAKAIGDIRYQDYITNRDHPDVKPIEREFYQCQVDRVPELVDAYYKLRDDPNDVQSRQVVSECRTSSMQLDRIKYGLHEIPWTELAALGIDRSNIKSSDLQQLREGGETVGQYDISYKVGQSTTIVGDKSTLQMYRDLDGRPQVDVKAPYPVPEYKSESNRLDVSAEEEESLARGKTLTRAVTIDHHGRSEKCLVGFRPDTNRLVKIPLSELSIPDTLYGKRVTPTQKNEIKAGRTIYMEGCKTGDTEFSARFQFDVQRMGYTPVNPQYNKPYIPKSIKEQLDGKQIKDLENYKEIDARNVIGQNGRPYSVLGMNPETNSLYWGARQNQNQEQHQTQNKEKENKDSQSTNQVREQAEFEDKNQSKGLGV